MNRIICCKCLDFINLYSIIFYEGSSYCEECLIKTIKNQQEQLINRELNK